jgi:uncharacterized protein
MNRNNLFLFFNNRIFLERNNKIKSGWRGVPLLIIWILACRILTPIEGVSPAEEVFRPERIDGPVSGHTQSPPIDFDSSGNEVIPAGMETAPATAEAPLFTSITQLPTPPFTLEPTLPATPNPYAYLHISTLETRSYGGGQIALRRVMEDTPDFTKFLISYPSDRLTIYGFMNLPKTGAGPFPVVIALHGYIDPAIYHTLDYTTKYADELAKAGFLVLHPNLRNYPPSDSGENKLRVGMAIDVLNLIALVKDQGGLAGPLQMANPEAIGLWGHSMGGGISTRVMVVSPDVRAVVLYGAMSGDEKQNFTAIYEWSNGERGGDELSIPETELVNISPVYYLDRVRARVSIHHGEDDQLVPLGWSQEICRLLIDLGNPVECFIYPGQRHTFNEKGNLLFNERVIDFFNRELR